MHEELSWDVSISLPSGDGRYAVGTQSEVGAWSCQHVDNIQSHDSGEESPGWERDRREPETGQGLQHEVGVGTLCAQSQSVVQFLFTLGDAPEPLPMPLEGGHKSPPCVAMLHSASTALLLPEALPSSQLEDSLPLCPLGGQSAASGHSKEAFWSSFISWV